MSWSIICDFDGTIVEHDSADLIFEQFASPEWLAVEELWQQGVIGSAECMQRQVALINTTVVELDALLETIKLDSAFPEFVNDCKRKEMPLIIVSDGLDYVIHHLLRKYQLDYLPVIANHFNCLENGKFVLTCPQFHPDCKTQAGVCKCAVVKSIAARQTLYIGDGRSDFCVAARADLVLAKTSLLKYCQTQAIPHLPFTNFTEVRSIVEYLTMMTNG